MRTLFLVAIAGCLLGCGSGTTCHEAAANNTMQNDVNPQADGKNAGPDTTDPCTSVGQSKTQIKVEEVDRGAKPIE